jgi:hypothetical protein
MAQEGSLNSPAGSISIGIFDIYVVYDTPPQAVTYEAITDTLGVTSGSRMLYSPDLFDTTTGDYPIANIPAVVTYQIDPATGSYYYFAGKRIAGDLAFWPTSDTAGAGAAYSYEDQQCTDLTQAPGVYQVTLPAPNLSELPIRPNGGGGPGDYDGSVTHSQVVEFSFVNSDAADTAKRSLKLNLAVNFNLDYGSNFNNNLLVAAQASLIVSVDPGTGSYVQAIPITYAWNHATYTPTATYTSGLGIVSYNIGAAYGLLRVNKIRVKLELTSQTAMVYGLDHAVYAKGAYSLYAINLTGL